MWENYKRNGECIKNVASTVPKNSDEKVRYKKDYFILYIFF